MNKCSWSWRNGLLKAVKDSTDHWTIASFIISAALMGTLMGFAEATVLLVGIALHELGHILAAVRQGIPILPTRFLPFVGGVARVQSWAKTAYDEVAIALAGPVVGLMVAAVVLTVAYLLKSEWVGKLAAIQAGINLFNLLPIHPLDGGRVAKAITRSMGTKAGTVLAVASIALALLAAYALEAPVFILVAAFSLREWKMERMARRELMILEGLRPFEDLVPCDFPSDARAILQERREVLRSLLHIEPLTKRDFAITALACIGLVAALVLVLIQSLMLWGIVQW